MNYKILVVEDEGIVALDLQQRLLKLGYQVPALAFSGEEAVRKVEEFLPGLVLMDIRLRGSMDGIAAAHIIKSGHDIPIIFLTALGDEATYKQALSTGPVAILSKPYEMSDLEAVIVCALQSRIGR
jgi:two-component system, response regulator PdtaR